jgi:DNA-binding transcriptional LysR family regulator
MQAQASNGLVFVLKRVKAMLVKPNRIKLSQLRALLLVAQSGNFSETALQLGISQSAVSHAIAALEDELGVMLFSRGRQGAQLTSAGESVAQYAKQMLRLLDNMVEDAQLHRGLQAGRVRVAAFQSVSTHLLPQKVATFRDRFPNIAITLHECFDSWDVEQMLREGQADVGLIDDLQTDGFETYEIMRDEYIALLPPTTPMLNQQLTWEQMKHFPLISYVPGNSCHTRLQDYLRKHHASMTIAYEVRESSTIVGMVAQGLGMAILSRLSAGSVPSEIQVCRLPVPFERVISAAVVAESIQPPPVFAFLETLQTAAPLIAAHACA